MKLLEYHGRVLDAGNVVFPISYIIGDVLTEVWGFKAARRVIWIGFFCNLLAALAIQAAIHLPPAGFWGDQQAYETILGFSRANLSIEVCVSCRFPATSMMLRATGFAGSLAVCASAPVP